MESTLWGMSRREGGCPPLARIPAVNADWSIPMREGYHPGAYGLARARHFRISHGVFLLFLVVAIPAFQGCERRQEAVKAPPPEVRTAEVVRRDVPVVSEWVGTMDGFVNATIRAQVTGYLQKQAYREGSFVKKGDLLFEIDPRPFKAALIQAEGQLAQAQARYGKTELDVKRYTPLAQGQAISRQELDNAVQANLEAKAAVRSAEAAMEQASLNLGFTKIVAPISGIAGVAAAQIGDLVGPGQSGNLTTVSTVDPIKVYFPISEQEYMAIVGRLPGTDGNGLEEENCLEMVLADGSVYPRKGKFYFTGRQVDERTGTIRMAALFPNPGNVLRPGQFARIRMTTQIRKNALLIPQRSVIQQQGANHVAVVEPDDRVSLRPVQLGPRFENLWVIEGGLKPGERVVVEGIQKVKDGQVVHPRPQAVERKPAPRDDASETEKSE